MRLFGMFNDSHFAFLKKGDACGGRQVDTRLYESVDDPDESDEDLGVFCQRGSSRPPC